MATKTIAWNSGGGYIRLAYTGSGNGTISVTSDVNNGAARSQTISVKTTYGGVITKNITVNQDACPFPVGDVKSYAYTGTVQSVLLPAGSYKLQCWGAQGGSNAAASTYGITAKAGGKGGYSEGVLTLSSPTTVYIFVGGQGSTSGNGGWNGGGGSKGSDSKTFGDTSTVSRFGCGGGATDIALTTSSMSYSSYRTNRSAVSLLSRMIVAGGGSGASVCRRIVTSSTTIQSSSYTPVYATVQTSNNNTWISQTYQNSCTVNVQSYRGYSLTSGNVPSGVTSFYTFLKQDPVLNQPVSFATGYSGIVSIPAGGSFSVTVPSDAKVLVMGYINGGGNARYPSSLTFTTTSTSYLEYVGYIGGGVNGDGYSDSTIKNYGRQDGAGREAGFGYGANHYNSSFLYNSASNLFIVSVFLHNIAANAQYRPSGYTGLQLDSGETKDGNTSFPNTAGTGNETGHAGNGYAKITRLS